jgi:hypothetical protein
LQIIYDETDGENLIQFSENHFESYIKSINQLEPDAIIKSIIYLLIKPHTIGGESNFF